MFKFYVKTYRVLNVIESNSKGEKNIQNKLSTKHSIQPIDFVQHSNLSELKYRYFSLVLICLQDFEQK